MPEIKTQYHTANYIAMTPDHGAWHVAGPALPQSQPYEVCFTKGDAVRRCHALDVRHHARLNPQTRMQL